MKHFKKLRALVSNFDKHSADQMQNFKAEIEKAVNDRENYFVILASRTDLSDDDKLEIECLEPIINFLADFK